MIRKQRILVLVTIALIFCTMFAGWWLGTGQDISGHASKFIAIGRLAGIVATASVLLELLLMSRAPFIERNFDLEEINEFHRLNGYTMVCALVVHVVFLVMGYGVNSNLGWWAQFLQLNTGVEDVLKASIGSVVFIVTAVTSLHMLRKHLPYEVWYFIHIVVYGGVLLAFGHQVNSGGDIVSQKWMQIFWYAIYAIVFGLLAYYRFGRQLIYFLRFDFRVNQVSQESSNIYSIYITGRNLEKFKYLPGSYAQFRFLTKGLALESHPFSFVSSQGSDYLRITVKASGDFTKDLFYVKQGSKVLVDGPRGAFTANRASNNRVLLVAGGIGVAPFLAIARTLLNEGKAVHILYSLHDISEAVFAKEFSNLKTEFNKFSISIRDTSAQGRISPTLLSNYTVGDVTKLNVFACGPDSMTASVRKMLEELGTPHGNIVTERFTF